MDGGKEESVPAGGAGNDFKYNLLISGGSRCHQTDMQEEK